MPFWIHWIDMCRILSKSPCRCNKQNALCPKPPPVEIWLVSLWTPWMRWISQHRPMTVALEFFLNPNKQYHKRSNQIINIIIIIVIKNTGKILIETLEIDGQLHDFRIHLQSKFTLVICRNGHPVWNIFDPIYTIFEGNQGRKSYKHLIIKRRRRWVYIMGITWNITFGLGRVGSFKPSVTSRHCCKGIFCVAIKTCIQTLSHCLNQSLPDILPPNRP